MLKNSEDFHCLIYFVQFCISTGSKTAPEHNATNTMLWVWYCVPLYPQLGFLLSLWSVADIIPAWKCWFWTFSSRWYTRACALIVPGFVLTIVTIFLSAEGDRLGLLPDHSKVATPPNNLYLSNKSFLCCAQRIYQLLSTMIIKRKVKGLTS